MKILFVPVRIGVISHGIPLLALNKMLGESSIETAFLLPVAFHKVMRRLGANVLDIDYTGFRSELAAYSKFSPDIIVDDSSADTGIATAVTGLPRVTIQRTGSFPGAVPLNKHHSHSMNFHCATIPDLTSLGMPQPKTLVDLFQANIKIVPSIKSIEAPPKLVQDNSYVYSGPLLIDDHLLPGLAHSNPHNLDGRILKDFDLLRQFFDVNKGRGRRIVYVTFGNIAKAPVQMLECIRYMLMNDMAVVSNVEYPALEAIRDEQYYYAKYLPMHFICSNADVMIHHCGSGTYQYSILHNLPALTIGTKCYDRDDVAARLQELGASLHLPCPDEAGEFFELFKRTIRKYFDGAGAFISSMKNNLSKLQSEIEATCASFNFEEIVSQVVDSSKRSQQSRREHYNQSRGG